MAAPLAPGDFVECINACAHRSAGVLLTLGAIYRVREVSAQAVLFSGNRGPTLRLCGIVLAVGPYGVEASWAICRFKPVYRPKSEIIEALKAPPKHAPIRISEPA